MNAPAFHIGVFKLKLVERHRWAVVIADRLCVAELKTLVAHKYNVDDEEEWRIYLDDSILVSGENLYELLKEARDVLTGIAEHDTMMQEGRTE